jgi:hypothetical protein
VVDSRHRHRPPDPRRELAHALLRVLACVALACAPATARAAWPPSPATNLPVCVAIGYQSDVVAISDNSGGMFVAWTDARFIQKDIFVQHVSSAGVPLWKADGVMVAGAASDQTQPGLVLDGVGGVIVSWRDLRSIVETDLYAQRVNAAGLAMWVTNGVPVCLAAGDQINPVIVSDRTARTIGASGAIIAWEDYRAGIRIFAQHLQPDGTVTWATNGVAASTSFMAQFQPVIQSDQAGGAFIAWSQQGATGYDIVAQHVGLLGGALWNAGGVSVCAAPGNQLKPRLTPDGNGGTWCAWEDGRAAVLQVYAQHVVANGTGALPANGVAVAPWGFDQTDPVTASDQVGGVIVAWHDARGDEEIHAQLLDLDGQALWGTGGITVCGAPRVQQFPVIVEDGAGGALVAWEDLRGGDSDIYAQRISDLGALRWTASGQPACMASGGQYGAVLVRGTGATALVLWSDQRSNSSDVYAQNVPANNTLEVPGPAVTAAVMLSASPNPAPGRTTLAFRLPESGAGELAILDAAGRRVRSLARGAFSSGDHREAWDGRDEGGRAVAAGLYFAQLRVDGRTLVSRRVVLLP